jgi:DNA-binding MarR family transcriptional regulator
MAVAHLVRLPQLALISLLIICVVMTDHIGFLLSDVARLTRKRFDERARSMGATRAQWKTLFTLSRNEGLNQGALAELLEVEPITLCRMIDRLEDAGLVERRRDPADRRAWRIYLTADAGPVIERLRSLAAEMFEAALGGMGEDERTALGRSLETIHSNLNALPAPNEAAHG